MIFILKMLINIMNLNLLREPRFFGFVVFDTVASVIAAMIISYELNVNLALTILISLVLSIILHNIFGINTHTNYLLGLSDKPF
jgi:hypothetical protein